MLTWDGKVTVVRREARFAWSLIIWPFIVVWWCFVDYVWPWLWRALIGIAIGVTLGLLIRVYYFGEQPGGWWP